MRILVVDTLYGAFIDQVYAHDVRGDPGLRGLPYELQRNAILRRRFGTSDFYSRHLRALGHECVEVFANCAPLQAAWAREHGLSLVARVAGRPGRVGRAAATAILLAQVRRLRPDVLYLQDLGVAPAFTFRTLRRYARVIAGQIASPLPPAARPEELDVLFSSLPGFVEQFRAMGIRAEHLRIAFEPSVLEELQRLPHAPQPRDIACLFIGGVGPAHASRVRFLEEVAQSVDLTWFGYGAETLPPTSALRRAHRGEAWGLDVYRLLTRARIALNHHIDIAGDDANNMRLYEATGCGAMLLTDAKRNLGELFDVGREVVAFTDAADAIEGVRYHLAHDDERSAIAAAGQRRTLHDHTYARRMSELAEMLDEVLEQRGPERGRG